MNDINESQYQVVLTMQLQIQAIKAKDKYIDRLKQLAIVKPSDIMKNYISLRCSNNCLTIHKIRMNTHLIERKNEILTDRANNSKQD